MQINKAYHCIVSAASLSCSSRCRRHTRGVPKLTRKLPKVVGGGKVGYVEMIFSAALFMPQTNSLHTYTHTHIHTRARAHTHTHAHTYIHTEIFQKTHISTQGALKCRKSSKSGGRKISPLPSFCRMLSQREFINHINFFYVYSYLFENSLTRGHFE